MILLVICEEKNKKTGIVEDVVSHGINSETLMHVCLQQETFTWYRTHMKVFWSNEYISWVMLENNK